MSGASAIEVMAGTPGDLSDDLVLTVRGLSVVPEGEDFIVGDPASGVYVVLPAIGVRVLEAMRGGATLGDVRAEARRDAGEDVDVVAFAQSLLELGLATPQDAESGPREDARRPVAPWLRRAFSRVAWAGYAGCAAAVVALFALRPALFPRVSDIFFLSTPIRSLAGITVITYALAAAHEGCHWLAARAEGVGARVSFGRRLYFPTLEIDLTGLWSLPRKRRYSALFAGMAFDALVLLAILGARYGDGAGWWQLHRDAASVLGAVSFVEVAALMSQVWIFARTDLYAVLITAAGCVNLFRVNQLLVRRTLHLMTPAQGEELRRAAPRDLAVARWFRWLYLLGLAAAAWFFVTYFAPATIRLVRWTADAVTHQTAGSERFWEAVIFGGLILMPYALTMRVVLRDLRHWRLARASTRAVHPA